MALSTSSRVYIVVGSGIILLGLVAFIIYPLFFSGSSDNEQSSPVVIQDRTQVQPLPASNIIESSDAETNIEQDSSNSTEAAQKSQIETTTRLFVERFGSYSNYSDFENIKSLFSMMTGDMKAYSQTIINQGVDRNDYNSVITTLITYNLASFNESSSAIADITIQEQRQVEVNGETEVNIKQGRVELVYQSGKWLVDRLFYE